MSELLQEMKRVRELAQQQELLNQQVIEVTEWRNDDLASSSLTSSPTVKAFDQEEYRG
jgi:hypothetical protein